MGLSHKRLRLATKQIRRPQTRCNHDQNTAFCIKRLQNEKTQLSVYGLVKNRSRTFECFDAFSRGGGLVNVLQL